MLTKNQAIDAFFYVEYTEENVIFYRKQIEELHDSKICWNLREQEPILVSKQRIRGDPLTYNEYLDEAPPEEEKVSKRERFMLTAEAEIKQFINEVFRPSLPDNNSLYSKGIVSTRDIHELVNKHSTVFREKTVQSFATWCRNQKLDFLLAKRKIRDKIASRELYIMKDICYSKPRYDT